MRPLPRSGLFGGGFFLRCRFKRTEINASRAELSRHPVQSGAGDQVAVKRNRAGRIEWCLPKGHQENDETLIETAEREVEEETGIQGRVLTTLGTIDYWFSTHDRRIHKVVHHYLLEAIGGYLTVEKDPDQEAIDVAWIPLGRVQERLTFPNERRIAQLAWERLAGEG